MNTRVVEIGACISCPYYDEQQGKCEITNNEVFCVFNIESECPLLTIKEFIIKNSKKGK